jgi:predicted nucleic acid-binding protein
MAGLDSGLGIVQTLIVVEEVASGDYETAQRRLAHLAGIDILEVTDEAIELAARLLENDAVPQKATQDALHIAVACVNHIRYLLTWNYRQIANATMREAINRICSEAGYDPPVICSPAELN